MRISYVVNSLATGGAERLVVDLATEAKRRGHEVRIVVLGSEHGIPAESAETEGLEVVSLRRNARSPLVLSGLRRAIGSADVVHSHLFPAQYWAATLPHPKVFTEHSTRNRRMNRLPWRLPERLIYNRYQQVVCITPGVRDSLVSHLDWSIADPRLSIVGNGIRGDFFGVKGLPRAVGDGLKLVAVGSLRPVKNFQRAIAAVSQVPAVRLDIVGDGPLHPEMQRQINSSGLGNRVRLLGPVSEMPSLLAEYDALISTSEYEGFALVAAEALAVGLPVIGPNISGFNSVVADGIVGDLYDPDGGVEAVANSIRRVLRSDYRLGLASAARDYAGRFTIEACFSSYEGIYEHAIAEWRERS